MFIIVLIVLGQNELVVEVEVVVVVVVGVGGVGGVPEQDSYTLTGNMHAKILTVCINNVIKKDFLSGKSIINYVTNQPLTALHW